MAEKNISEQESIKDMCEFRIMEDLDGKYICPWGESVKPKSSTKLVYVSNQLISTSNSEESVCGYSQFVVPEEFGEDLEKNNIEYLTFLKNGKETGIRYRLTKIG